MNSLEAMYAERYMKSQNTDTIATIDQELIEEARNHLKYGDYESAKDTFSDRDASEIRKRKLRYLNRDPVAHRILGAIKGYQRDFDGARREHLFHAEELCRKELSAVYVNISGTFLEENNPDDAIRYAQMALELYPGWAMPDVQLACGYVLKDDKAKAVTSLRQVKEHFPNAMNDTYFRDRMLSDAFLSVLTGIPEYDELVNMIKLNQTTGVGEY